MEAPDKPTREQAKEVVEDFISWCEAEMIEVGDINDVAVEEYIKEYE